MAIYLDNNATTSCHPAVLEAMRPFWHCDGNAAAIHRHGRFMRSAIDTAREQVATLTNAHPSEIIFTSGGTEANNLAIKGFAFAQPEPGEMLIGSIEHDCVVKSAQALTKFGWACNGLPVGTDGRYSSEDLMKIIGTSNAALLSVMLANNETGIIQPVQSLAEIARAQGVLSHSDAVQALGKIPVDFQALGLDMMTVSAHKMGGPIGVGALIKKAQVTLEPLLHGGSHQQGVRAGTENTAMIAGFGKMCEIAQKELADRQSHLAQLQQTLEIGMRELPGVSVIGAGVDRLPNTSLITVSGTDGEMSLMMLDKKGFSVSSGSACGNLTVGGSHVLAAMGIEPALASTAIRISTGMNNTISECEQFLAALGSLIKENKRTTWV